MILKIDYLVLYSRADSIFLQGLILSNALRAQKNAENESCQIALGNLRSEVIKLRNEVVEKDKILLSLVDKVKKDKAKFNAQSEAHKAEVEDLRKKLAEANENFELAKVKQEISEWSNTGLEKNVEELRKSKERCFEKSFDCVRKLKNSFAKVGAYSSEENLIRGDLEGVIDWISGEAEAFEEFLSDRRDICAFTGAQGVAAILEKASCDHVKAAAQTDTKDPSAEATLVGRKFYSDVWVNGGRDLANEIIKKNEKETHDAREEAKRAEEVVERARRICIISEFYLWCLFSGF
jgi:cell division septum initiation protein DivIVA